LSLGVIRRGVFRIIHDVVFGTLDPHGDHEALIVRV